MNELKSCVICGLKFKPIKTTQRVCSISCAVKFAKEKERKKKERETLKERRKRKREFWDNDIETRKKAAKEWCHKYIRLRDKNDTCICCGRPLGKNYQAGHFIPSGQNPLVRYDENNIHAQRLDCNYYRGGDSGDYEKNLIKKIGAEKVEELKSKKGGSLKRTAQDYKEIELYYRKKIKELS